MLAIDYATVSRPSVCLSVRLSVTFRYVFHTGWNRPIQYLKIISRLISLIKVSARADPNMTPTMVQRDFTGTPQNWNSTKTCNISEKVQDMTKVTMTN